MARPRLATKNLSKWGVWKRQQRENPATGLCSRCGKRPATVKHHPETHNEKPRGRTVNWCRECNAAHHNALRARNK